MRGTDNFPGAGSVHGGITPACAGNSPGPPPLRPSCQDHPRVCGEQCPARYFRRGRDGSPPRVRGTERQDVLLHAKPRITPACAGNSVLIGGFLQHLRDHPRVCGEQPAWHMCPKFLQGSPPRVRGTAIRAFSIATIAGITPACAGNRLKKARHFYILFCQIKRIHLV